VDGDVAKAQGNNQVSDGTGALVVTRLARSSRVMSCATSSRSTATHCAARTISPAVSVRRTPRRRRLRRARRRWRGARTRSSTPRVSASCRRCSICSRWRSAQLRATRCVCVLTHSLRMTCWDVLTWRCRTLIVRRQQHQPRALHTSRLH
jgi:hypothetical protein